LFGRAKTEADPALKEIGLLGTDTKFEGAIRFTGTLRIDGVVVGNISSEPGSGSVLIINQQATVQGDIVSDSVLISGKVEGNVRAEERVEIFRSGLLKGDVFTNDIMIEGGAEFQGYCHMANGAGSGAESRPAGAPARGGRPSRAPNGGGEAGAPAEGAAGESAGGPDSARA
jgi:cytoskeletal protein CcmA (bactofilin family)